MQAECAVLGAVLLDPGALFAASELLQPEDFYLNAHRLIYLAMLELQKRESGIDAVTLKAELESQGKLEAAGGIVYVMRLTDGMPRGANVRAYASLVRETSTRRQIVRLTAGASERAMTEDAAKETIEGLQMDLLKLGEREKRGGWRSAAELVNQAYSEIDAIAKRKTDVTGLDTGYSELNRITQGFHRGEMIVIAGRPGHGKTSYCMNMVANAILRHGTRVAVFSLEMTAIEIMKRLLYSEAEIDSYRASAGFLKKDDWTRLSTSAGQISETHLWVDESGSLTIMELRSRVQRLAVEHGVDLVVVDYLQLMTGAGRRSDNREREIAEMSRGLKCLAKDLSIPVIVVSQLNRQVETHQRRPQLADLRESGAIEQDADLVMFIWRDELRKATDDNAGIAELIIGKQRNGPTGSLKLGFLKQYVKFVELTQTQAQEPDLWYQNK
jgi:replicative DNA helicase